MEELALDAILVNHVGFVPSAHKSFVIPKPPQNAFTVLELKDTELTPVFQGQLEPGGEDLAPGWVGDFSSLQSEGIYQIRCGDLKSRYFVISADVYEVPMRTVFGYFPWQRCGDSLTGWCAPCHLQDGRIAETGETVDLTGGWHQSGDLRKWTWGLNLGLLGLAQYALSQCPRWDSGQIAEELRWGSDYYHRLMRPDGGLMDTINLPLGWGQREWYLQDSSAPAQWNTVRTQALVAIYFQGRDPTYARQCLQVAQRVWDHMTSPERPTEPYSLPIVPPRGHDWMPWFFGGFYPGSALDWAHQLCAALAMHQATRADTWLGEATRCANALVKLQIESDSKEDPATACFWEGPKGTTLANSYWYFWHTTGPLGLCDLVKLLPDHRDAGSWMAAVTKIAEQYRRMAQRNSWGLIPGFWRAGDVTATEQVDHNTPAGQRGRPWQPLTSRDATQAVPCYYSYFAGFVVNLDILSAALFLRRAGDLTDEPEYVDLAQRQLDWVLGCNPLDSSTVEAVGSNQPHRGIYGEFFPPTPQIPGAVMTGLLGDANDEALSFKAAAEGHYGCYWLEYDNPPTGVLLWLFAELSRETES